MTLPETKIAILRRFIAGESCARIALDYHHAADWIRSHIWQAVSDQLEYHDDDDETDEWHQALNCKYGGSREEYRTVWCPLALERWISAGRPNSRALEQKK